MGEYKNTIIAIVLSLVVVIGWQYFIGYPQMQRQQEQAQLKKQEQAQVQPGAAQPNAAQPSPSTASAPPVPNAPTTEPPAASRAAVIAASPHVTIDTPRLQGSIDLKGGRIDDLSLTQYREDVDPNSPPIVLFSPSGAPDAYYAEFGWVPAAGTTAAMPGPDTMWKRDGSGTLGVDHPVTLSYDNGQGLI
ncbi:MAG: membrane protein insertase YidC, partial [Xanthobacteraceae bacterium]